MTDDDFQKIFFHIILAGRKNNSYKFALARSILNYVNSNVPEIKKNIQNNKTTAIPYQVFAEDFFKYYWHQCKAKIPQNFNSDSLPRAVSIVKKIFDDEKHPQPEKFVDVNEDVRKKAVKQILSGVFNKFDSKTSQVVPRFQNIMEGNQSIQKEPFYKNEEKNKRILVNPDAMKFFIRNRILLEKFVIFEWAKFLNNIKTSPGIILNLEDPKYDRDSLKPFERILKKYFDNCFYCKGKLSHLPDGVKIHVDHFIPRSYVGNDSMWNFVLSCSRCNLSKSDSLADDFKNKFFKNISNYKNKIPKLKRSIKNLDEKKWKKEIEKIYDNCQDYGFTKIAKSDILKWKNDSAQ